MPVRLDKNLRSALREGARRIASDADDVADACPLGEIVGGDDRNEIGRPVALDVVRDRKARVGEQVADQEMARWPWNRLQLTNEVHVSSPPLLLWPLHYHQSRQVLRNSCWFSQTVHGGAVFRAASTCAMKASHSAIGCPLDRHSKRAAVCANRVIGSGKISGTGGEVGPDLSDVGAKQKRDYLLESIVLPSKIIAKGFESVVLTLSSGKTITGILRSEDAREVQVMTPEGQLLKVAKDQIEERTAGKSAMPEDLIKHLSRQDLRDLVEFLAGLKGPAPAASR